MQEYTDNNSIEHSQRLKYVITGNQFWYLVYLFCGLLYSLLRLTMLHTRHIKIVFVRLSRQKSLLSKYSGILLHLTQFCHWDILNQMVLYIIKSKFMGVLGRYSTDFHGTFHFGCIKGHCAKCSNPFKSFKKLIVIWYVTSA